MYLCSERFLASQIKVSSRGFGTRDRSLTRIFWYPLCLRGAGREETLSAGIYERLKESCEDMEKMSFIRYKMRAQSRMFATLITFVCLFIFYLLIFTACSVAALFLMKLCFALFGCGRLMGRLIGRIVDCTLESYLCSRVYGKRKDVSHPRLADSRGSLCACNTPHRSWRIRAVNDTRERTYIFSNGWRIKEKCTQNPVDFANHRDRILINTQVEHNFRSSNECTCFRSRLITR